MRLSVDLGSGRTAIFTLNGGTATALQSGNNIHLEINDAGKGAALSMVIKGGGIVNLSNVDVTGNLKSMNAPAAVLNGTLTVSGSVGRIKLGSLPGNIDVTGGIGSLSAGPLGGTLSAGGSAGKLKLGDITGKINIVGNLLSLTAGNISGTVYAGGAIGRVKGAQHHRLGR